METAGGPSKFIEDILKIHNQYRAIHGSSPLRIDEKLNKHAQQLVRSLARDTEAPRDAVPYGENVYVGEGYPDWKMRPEEPVQYWYRENSNYDYEASQPTNLTDVRNFTQLVWKGSRSIGIGVVIGPECKLYLVCVYDPAGNVEGEFQRNVAPPKEEDAHTLSPRELELCFTELPAQVMRSMERLYAVPSEKLRVWMAWLIGIGEIADEWYKWLRAHFDLIARIAEMVASGETPGGRKIESVANAKSDGIPDNAEPVEPAEKATTSEKKVEKKKVEESRDAPGNLNNGDDGGGEMTTATTWPIGTRWRPLTPPFEREADQTETIRRLDLPKDRAEMIELLENFIHQATLYRSYYKHWKKTADQAVREIAGRTVMATARIQDTGRQDDTEYPTRQAREATDVPAEEGIPSRPTVSVIDLPTDASEAPIALSDDQYEVEETWLRMSEMEDESLEIWLPDEDATTIASGTTTELSEIAVPSLPKSKLDGIAKRDAAKKLVKDVAQIDDDDDVLYFFSLKVGPDMDIAMQHNDKKAIPPDIGLESISANRRHLYFNLTDKLRGPYL